MENYNHQQYRDQLAKEIKETPRDSRQQKLAEAKQSDEYQKASIFKIEERYRDSLNEQYRKFEEHDVKFDSDKPPNSFQGITGNYKFENYSKMLLDSVVSDETDRKFFITTKRPEKQALASILGNFLSKDNPALARLKFPEIRLEKINGKTVALMEYFDGYDELNYDKETQKNLGQLDFFTDEERAFLEIYNLWIGNWDFKYDHALFSSGKNSVGLIDLEMSFDFDRSNRIDQTVAKSIFLGEEMSDENKAKILKIISNLNISDRNKIIKHAVDSGFNPDETIQIVFELLRRRKNLDEEIKTVRLLYKAKERL